LSTAAAAATTTTTALFYYNLARPVPDCQTILDFAAATTMEVAVLTTGTGKH